MNECNTSGVFLSADDVINAAERAIAANIKLKEQEREDAIQASMTEKRLFGILPYRTREQAIDELDYSVWYQSMAYSCNYVNGKLKPLITAAQVADDGRVFVAADLIQHLAPYLKKQR
jgi:hypothetical protein